MDAICLLSQTPHLTWANCRMGIISGGANLQQATLHIYRNQADVIALARMIEHDSMLNASPRNSSPPSGHWIGCRPYCPLWGLSQNFIALRTLIIIMRARKECLQTEWHKSVSMENSLLSLIGTRRITRSRMLSC
ncbi:hypothetical protein D5086_029411 [Populus alba]|uniref:Uncharacterized protein n=1 Tax=Populus alba TaxID=43335 RepID=A0ACC4AU13_POPAL